MESIKKTSAIKKVSTHYIVMTALFTAMAYVVTLFINIPANFLFVANGNINLGDTVVIIAGILLGPWGGLAVGAIGPTFADITSAYFVYAPFTMVIKGIEGFMCGLLYKKILAFTPAKFKKAITVFSPIILIMAGYFFAELIILTLLGNDSDVTIIAASISTLVPNFIQGIASGLAAYYIMLRISDTDMLLRKKV